jgi:hypothetical protein
LNEGCTKRTVVIELTEEQIEALKMERTSSNPEAWEFPSAVVLE